MLSTTDNPEVGLFEFQSLGSDVVERWKDSKASATQYQMIRKYDEFRFAEEFEVIDSFKARATYYLRKLLRLLHIHKSRFEDW